MVYFIKEQFPVGTHDVGMIANCGDPPTIVELPLSLTPRTNTDIIENIRDFRTIGARRGKIYHYLV